jgi:hypothetical protein
MIHPDPFKNSKRRTITCWWCGTSLGQVVKKVVTPDGREEKVHQFCETLFRKEMECTQP